MNRDRRVHGSAGPTDADLVAGVLAGDREAFAQVYDRYADRLHDFAHSMLRHPEDAADAVADSFVTAAERLGQLRDPTRLRPWLYAVVRRECLRRLRERGRAAYDGDVHLQGLADSGTSPESAAEQESLRVLLRDAAEGLGERDQRLLDLHLRHGLDGAELGEAVGMTAANAYVGMSRLRGQLERSLGALLVARVGRRECADLDSLLTGWDGHYTPLWRKRVARHVDSCDVCRARRSLVLQPGSLLSVAPLLLAPAALRDRVLDDHRLVSSLEAYAGPGAPGPASGVRPVRRARALSRGTRAATAATAAAIVATLVAGTVVARTLVDGSEEVSPQADRAVLTPSPDLAAPAGTSESPDAEETGGPAASDDDSGRVVPGVEDATGSTTPVTPSRLDVGQRDLDLGAQGTRRLRLTNPGGAPVRFTASPDAGWILIDGAAGTVRPGESRDVTVGAQRSALAEGASQARLLVTWAGGSVPVTVRAGRESAPDLGRVAVVRTACLGEGTRRLWLAVPVSDESGVRTVSVTWSLGGDSGSAALAASGDRWAGQIGPLTPGGVVGLETTATDSRGNRATRIDGVTAERCGADRPRELQGPEGVTAPTG